MFMYIHMCICVYICLCVYIYVYNILMGNFQDKDHISDVTLAQKGK